MIAIGLMISSTNAIAQTEDFYKNKTVSLVVSSSAGGIYDLTARTIANYLGKHIPGNPTIVVKNMFGAGGIVATNYLYNISPKDGLEIGLVQGNTPFEPLLGTKGAIYDCSKFNWLGSPGFDTAILQTWNTVPVKSIEEARKIEITSASSGANSAQAFYSRMLNELLGLNLKIISGYTGQADTYIAMERGEVDAYASGWYSSLKSSKPSWLIEKKVTLLVQYGPEPEKEILDVPTVASFLTNDDDRKLYTVSIAQLALGRPLLTPPGVPADRVEILRKALMETLISPEFIAEANRLNLGLNTPRSADQLKKIVDDVYATPEPILNRMRKWANPPQ